MFVRELKERLKNVPDDLEIVHWEGEWGYVKSDDARIRPDIKINRYDTYKSVQILSESFVIQ